MKTRKQSYNPDKHIIGAYVDWEIHNDRKGDFVAYTVHKDNDKAALFWRAGNHIKLSYFIDEISEEWHDELGYASMVDNCIVEQMDQQVIKVYEIKTDSPRLGLVAVGRPGYAHPTTTKEQL